MCNNDGYLEDIEKVIRKDMKAKSSTEIRYWIANPHKYAKEKGLQLWAVLDILAKIEDELECPHK